MAEAAGLVFGVAGLAGLFSSCIQVFDMLQMANTMDFDLRILHQRLENQKLRFANWGQSLGLDGSLEGESALHGATFNELTGVSIMRNMEILRETFQNARSLEKRQGLHRLPDGDRRTPFAAALRRIQNRVQKGAQKPIRRPCLWVCTDRRQFQELLTNVEGLINDLESLTASCAPAVDRRRQIVEYEISELSVDDLESVAAASAGQQDHLLDAANEHLLEFSRADRGNERPVSGAHSMSGQPSTPVTVPSPDFGEHSSLSSGTAFYSASEGRFRFQSLLDPKRDIMRAIRTGDLAFVERILGPNSVNIVNTLQQGEDLFTLAIEADGYKIALMILERYLDILLDPADQDAVSSLAQVPQESVERTLTERALGFANMDRFGPDLLFVMIEIGLPRIFRAVAQAEPSLISTRNADGQTVLQKLLTIDGQFPPFVWPQRADAIKVVLECSALDIHAKNERGRNAFEAVATGWWEFAQLILQQRPECLEDVDESLVIFELIGEGWDRSKNPLSILPSILRYRP